MATKLRQWLENFELSLGKQRPLCKEPKITPPDLNDLAFTLATANEISETLPDILSIMQQQLDDLLPRSAGGKLLILFSSPITSESFLHHGLDEKPSTRFIQELHRTFTLKKPPASSLIELNLSNKHVEIAPCKLFETSNQTIWLVFSFAGKAPTIEQLKWRTAPFTAALEKGIKAWYQREEKIKAALNTERAIYAAELHDSLAQVLGYLRLKSAKLDKLCQKDSYQDLKPITEDLAAYTHCAYRQTRELITSSRLTMQTDNLAEGVVNSIKEFEQQSAIVFELDNRMQLNLLTPKQSMQILYIVRESLSNIVRHSHASHSRIAIKLSDNQHLQVIIEDNGKGIDSTATRSDSFGLQIMQERAARIGAKLSISHRKGGGTQTELLLIIGDEHE